MSSSSLPLKRKAPPPPASASTFVRSSGYSSSAYAGFDRPPGQEGFGVPPPNRRRLVIHAAPQSHQAHAGEHAAPPAPAAAAASGAAASSNAAAVSQDDERGWGWQIASAAAAAAAASSSPAPAVPVAAASSSVAVPHRRWPGLLPDRPSSNLMVNVLASRSLQLDPRALVVQQAQRRLSSLKLSAEKQVVSAHSHSVNDLDLDGTEMRYLLSAGGDGLISVFDVADALNSRGFTARPLHPSRGRDHGASVSCVQWYPFDTGMFVSGGSEGRVCVWDTNTCTVAHAFKMGGVVHAARMSAVATTHALIATGSNTPHVRLADMNSGAFSHTLLGHSSEVLSVDWSPGSEFHLVSGGADGRVLMWDIRRAGPVLSLDASNHAAPRINQKYLDPMEQRARRDILAHDGAVHHVRFTPQGDRLVTAGTDRALRVWDTSSGKNQLVHFEKAQARQRINRFAISSDGSRVFSPQGLAIHQYDVSTGELQAKLTAHFERVTCVAIHPQSHELFSAGADRSILVWTPADQGHLSKQQRDEEAAALKEEQQAEVDALRADERDAHMQLLRRVQARAAASASAATAAGASSSAARGRRAVLNADEDAWSTDEEADD